MWYMSVLFDLWGRLPPTVLSHWNWKPHVNYAVVNEKMDTISTGWRDYAHQSVCIADIFWGLYPLLFSSFRAQSQRPKSHVLLPSAAGWQPCGIFFLWRCQVQVHKGPSGHWHPSYWSIISSTWFCNRGLNRIDTRFSRFSLLPISSHRFQCTQVVEVLVEKIWGENRLTFNWQFQGDLSKIQSHSIDKHRYFGAQMSQRTAKEPTWTNRSMERWWKLLYICHLYTSIRHSCRVVDFSIGECGSS